MKNGKKGRSRQRETDSGSRRETSRGKKEWRSVEVAKVMVAKSNKMG